jgi:bromodomain-containing protein 8
MISGWSLNIQKASEIYFFSFSVSQPDTCAPMEAVGDPHTVTVSMDSSEISMIINSIKEECFRSGVAEAPGGSKAPSIDGKEDLDLAEKMDIAVSYTGEELDFETVGDIIAIIEDKVTIQQNAQRVS